MPLLLRPLLHGSLVKGLLIGVSALLVHATANAQSTSLAVETTGASRTAEDPNIVWTPSSVVVISKELAPGVFGVYPDDATRKNALCIPVATSGGFIIGNDGVLVVDSMLNRNLTNRLLTLMCRN